MRIRFCTSEQGVTELLVSSIPRLAVSLAVALTVTGCAQPPPVAAPAPAAVIARPVHVPLRPFLSNLRTVQVRTPAGDTLSFLLDTGGGFSLITPTVARSLGCEPFGRATGYRMSGERVDAELCADVTLSLGGVPVTHPTVAVLDLMALLPAGLPELHGLISLKSLEGMTVTLDLPGEVLTLESPASAASRTRSMRPLRTRVATGEGGGALTLFVAADAPRTPLWLLLDSGNLVGTILSPQAMRRLGRVVPDSLPSGPHAVPLRITGLPGEEHAATVMDLIHDGALGAVFFRRRLVTMDLATGRVWVSVEPVSHP
jgi:hypothetical protein